MRVGPRFLALLFGLQAGPALAADCRFQPFSTIPGADVALRWVEKSGHPCVLTITGG